uniref:glycosyltransferase family 4 protein n=1 Tax=Eubacterium sp. TaxID=142586 RepID=UPI004025BC9B
MKILMINKFLHPNGGSETYIFKLGECLKEYGNEVQYFGMEHENRCVGNNVGAYTSNMDFHGGSKLSKITYPVKTIYSIEARKKIRKVLDDFQPDVCHLNNFTYQLTPSIILEINKWRKDNRKTCKIVFTAHDYNLVCPNHMLNNPLTHENCESCLGGHFKNCIKGKCIHSSTAKSIVGAAEAYFWNAKGVYKYIDKIICCSKFMKRIMDSNPLFAKKTVVVHNFVDDLKYEYKEKENYVLYFGRFSEEKGIRTLLEVCKELPEVKFVFAGSGALEDEIRKVPNIECVGFKSGKELHNLISKAKFSVYPSEWYENCPFSVMESIMFATPVIASKIGGLPELVQDGVNGILFEYKNKNDLKNKISELWNDDKKSAELSENCKKTKFLDVDKYYHILVNVYID